MTGESHPATQRKRYPDEVNYRATCIEARAEHKDNKGIQYDSEYDSDETVPMDSGAVAEHQKRKRKRRGKAKAADQACYNKKDTLCSTINTYSQWECQGGRYPDDNGGKARLEDDHIISACEPKDTTCCGEKSHKQRCSIHSESQRRRQYRIRITVL